MEVEVETNLVLNKHIKLRVSDGSVLAGTLMVYECEEPFVLVVTVTPDEQTYLIDDEIIRIDIFKEDLSRELKQWLEGKYIHHPAALVPVRVDESIMKFIKFAKTPRQEDLIMWILSRCELHKVQHEFELIFGGADLDEHEHSVDKLKMTIENKYNKTATIAAAMATHGDGAYQLGGEAAVTAPRSDRPQSASALRTSTSLAPQNNEDLGMFEMTRRLLGRSATLEGMRTQRVKGREGARQTLAYSQVHLDPDSCKLVSEIERSRRDIVDKMDQRRRMIEVAKVRQLQSAEKYRALASQASSQKSAQKFVQQAQQELLTLQTVQLEIDDDIMKQRTRIHRGTQRVIWTKAPNGYGNLRGKSMKGPLLGPGPLPANATSALKDPAIERTIQKFYWDQAGRRHSKASAAASGISGGLGNGDDAAEASVVELAMSAIRKAAANISAFKLDLKAVFQQFDTSGDGFLSPAEMAQAFLAMGIKLDIPSTEEIFRHFDPNGSGSVHFGEFVWAFFNRRSLVRQWRRNTQGLTQKQVLSRFHQADTNGNGRLNPKEFVKLLKTFGVVLPPREVEILLERFDMDGDGEIDLHEFRAFIESEQAQLEAAGTNASTSIRCGGGAEQGAPVTRRPPSESSLRARPRSAHNVTAPAALQPSAYSAPAREESVQLRRPRVVRRDTSTSPSTHDDLDYHDALAQSRATAPVVAEAGEHDDVLWMSRMLQAQSEIESRLGHRYFRTRRTASS